MHGPPVRFSRQLPRVTPFVLLLAFGWGSWTATSAAAIDTGINQTVWKMLYGITDAQLNDPAWLAADDDGDGVSNGAELIAGTDPEHAASSFRVTATSQTASSVSLSFPTVAGKLYVAQSTNAIGDAASWTAVSPAVSVVGDGTNKTLVITKTGGANASFYRVNVQDMDTDGDGVSDWAEIVAGFDPTTAHTNGSATDDHTALTADLANENVFSAVATKSTATQPTAATVSGTDKGTITITRTGSLLFSAVTFSLNWSGTAIPGVDYTSLPTTVVMPAHTNACTLTVTPLYNANRRAAATVTCTVKPGGGYTLGAQTSVSVAIAPSGNATGTGLTGYYFNDTSLSSSIGTYSTALFNTANLKITRLDPTVDFTWATTAAPTITPGTGINSTYYTARWVGQVQPQYSETYYFDTVADDGVKLWVNGQLVIDHWTPYTSADVLGSISLQAGSLYDIKLEYNQVGGNANVHLNWYSNSQPKQVIPAARLYPDTTTTAPPAITSTTTAVGFVNQPFSFQVAAAVSGGAAPTFALGAGSGPLPAGLTLNAATGLISGTPMAAGDYQIALTATNPSGVGAGVLDIQILNAGSGVTRELWTSGVTGPNISDIPVNVTPNQIDNRLVTLEDNASYAADTGERLRGYFAAPVTGNYYFWVAANNAAELWISDDHESVNKVRRAWVASPGEGSRIWNDAAQTAQKSLWLAMVAGQSYYYEVLHNGGASAGAGNVAVGYFLDPTGTTASPIANGSGVVPGYVLTKYDYPPALPSTGSLYVTNLSPAAGVSSQAAGSANLQLNAAKTQAILHFSYSGLSSAQTSYGVYGPNDNGSDALLFDLNVIDKFHPELKTADGGYTWNITATSAVSTTTIVNDIQQGKAYLQVETVNNPNGEITGYFGLVLGSQVAPTPVADPGYTDDSKTDAGAARFLNQAAFGAAPADMASVESGGYASWIANQISLSPTHLLPQINAHYADDLAYGHRSTRAMNDWWKTAVTAPDQLRQRVAFAFSEIMVVSDILTALNYDGEGLSSFYDTLLDNSLGNFRSLLEAVTLHPTMGAYLNVQGNAEGNLATGLHPNENYAREVMQLFSIGLNRLWPDGTLVLDSTGSPVPTYNQGTITNGFARVFTGWTWHQALQSSGQLPTSWSVVADYVDPMVMVKNYHELGTKTLLDNVVLPQAIGYSPTASAVSGSQADTTNTAYDSYCLNDLEKAIDNIFYHPNVGPYICRQLIQRLVSSNPSPAYLYRVVSVFNDDGTSAHVRGNLQAVVQAILLDSEARSVAAQTNSSGKLREPIMRITGPARTFLLSPISGTFSQSGSQVIQITTTTPHGYAGGDAVNLDFSGNATGTPPVLPWNTPLNTFYTVLSTPAPTTYTFCVNAADVTTGTYTQAAGSTSMAITIATQPSNTNGPMAGGEVYLKFLSGSATDWRVHAGHCHR